MPLERLTLENFQTHEKIDVRLDPHLTTFVGPSDKGKTSVLRGLRWICLNQPQGTDFVRWGSEDGTTLVRLRADGRLVQRSRRLGRTRRGDDGQEQSGRADGSNHYSLDDKVYRAFGAGVPSPISDFLNVSDINFQRQLDPPLWFTLSPGQVSKELNSIVSLDLIDRTLENAARNARKATAAVEVSEDRLKAAEERVNALQWVREYDRNVRTLEKLNEERSRLLDKHARLSQTASEVSQAHETVRDAIRGILYAAKAVSRANEWKRLERRFSKLRTLLDQMAEWEHLSTLQGPTLASLEGYQELKEKYDRLSSLVGALAQHDYVARQAEMLILDGKKELAAKVCPICKRPWSDDGEEEEAEDTTPQPRSRDPSRRRNGTTRRGGEGQEAE